MFDWLDVDGSGEIEFTEFLHGFDWLHETVTGKSLLKIESAVKQKAFGVTPHNAFHPSEFELLLSIRRRI